MAYREAGMTGRAGRAAERRSSSFPCSSFIYLPIAVLVLFSFHAGKVPVPPFQGPSLEWYGKVLGNDRVLAATGSSVLVGLLSSAFATVLATLAAWGLARYAVPGRKT